MALSLMQRVHFSYQYIRQLSCNNKMRENLVRTRSYKLQAHKIHATHSCHLLDVSFYSFCVNSLLSNISARHFVVFCVFRCDYSLRVGLSQSAQVDDSKSQLLLLQHSLRQRPRRLSGGKRSASAPVGLVKQSTNAGFQQLSSREQSQSPNRGPIDNGGT